MKPSRIQKILPILEAYGEGKGIRGRISKDHEFQHIKELTEDHINGWELEIEPPPRHFYVNTTVDGDTEDYDTPEAAHWFAHEHGEENYESIAVEFIETK